MDLNTFEADGETESHQPRDVAEGTEQQGVETRMLQIQHVTWHLIGMTVAVRRANLQQHPFATGEHVKVTDIDEKRPESVHVQTKMWRQWMNPSQLMHVPGYKPSAPRVETRPEVRRPSGYSVVQRGRDQRSIHAIQSPDQSRTFTVGEQASIVQNPHCCLVPGEQITIVELDPAREDCIKARGRHVIDWIRPTELEHNAGEYTPVQPLIISLNQGGVADSDMIRVIS